MADLSIAISGPRASFHSYKMKLACFYVIPSHLNQLVQADNGPYLRLLVRERFRNILVFTAYPYKAALISLPRNDDTGVTTTSIERHKYTNE